MTHLPSSFTRDEIKARSSELSKVLEVLYDARPPQHGRQRLTGTVSYSNLLAHLSGSNESQYQTLLGVLAILHALGAIEIDVTGVRASSKHAAYLLGSLSKFLSLGIPAIDEPLDEGQAFRRITKIYEEARIAKPNVVSQTPLNERRVVNVIIVARKKRSLQFRKVFLHIFHPEWHQYHLIGLSGESGESDEELAVKALKTQLGLDPVDFEIDKNFNPKVKEEIRISETSGVLTRYSYRLFLVKNMHTPLHLENLMRKSGRRFEWFSREEIMEDASKSSPQIMFSTSMLVRSFDVESLPTITGKTDDILPSSNLREVIGRKFTYGQLLLLTVPFGLLITLPFIPLVLNYLGRSNIMLTNLASIGTVISGLVALFSVIPLWRSINRRDD